MSFKALFFSIFSSGGLFVQPNSTIKVILVKERKRNVSIYMYLFQNGASGPGGGKLMIVRLLSCVYASVRYYFRDYSFFLS